MMDANKPQPDGTPDEPLISEADPTEPDEGVENIEEGGEPFDGNFA